MDTYVPTYESHGTAWIGTKYCGAGARSRRQRPRNSIYRSYYIEAKTILGMAAACICDIIFHNYSVLYVQAFKVQTGLGSGGVFPSKNVDGRGEKSRIRKRLQTGFINPPSQNLQEQIILAHTHMHVVLVYAIQCAYIYTPKKSYVGGEFKKKTFLWLRRRFRNLLSRILLANVFGSLPPDDSDYCDPLSYYLDLNWPSFFGWAASSCV